MEHLETYFNEVKLIADQIDKVAIENLANSLAYVKQVKGRVFILGIGGSAANASHMVNDLRKLCGIEAYCPTDNVSEFSARTNDDGFESVFEKYLEISNFNQYDAIFILSVGGGNKEKNVSVNLIRAIDYVKMKKGMVIGIVGKPDGYAAQNGQCVVVPIVSTDRITPHSEAFQAVVWHSLVSHPKLQVQKTKW